MKTESQDMSVCEMSSEYGSSEEWYASDLQLAAELGKGLLDRNLELETSLKQQQALIEEQTQEIQMLSRQAAALREINETRLRVYEQLEASIAELETTNKQLKEEVSSDKKRIKGLCQSVDALETKCLELQQLVDEYRSSERLKKRRDRHRTAPLWVPVASSTNDGPSKSVAGPSPHVPLQRRHSFQDLVSQEDTDWSVRLKATLSKLKCQLAKEETTSSDLRVQIQILEQENIQLLEQQKQLDEQRERLIFYHQAERLYWSCMHCRHSDVETQQADEEGDDSLLASSADTFSLVELENGGLAYGDGDSLNGTLLDTTNIPVDRNRISLLSELDSQYRAIIKKYEDLVLSSGSPSLDCPDNLSPESPVDHAKETELFRSLSQQSEGSSSTSTSSSGVSSLEDEDSASALKDRGVQTEDKEGPQFRSGSPFKDLFEEIFTVLKRAAPIPAIQPRNVQTKTFHATQSSSEYRETSARKGTSVNIPKLTSDLHRKVGADKRYCLPVPSLIGFPLFKLPGQHSYAQALKTSNQRSRHVRFVSQPI